MRSRGWRCAKCLCNSLSSIFFVALECQICAALAKVQPAQPPLRSSAFPNAGGTVEDTQGSCMMERRLRRKFEWIELPAVLAEGLLRLHGAGVKLAVSVPLPPLSGGGWIKTAVTVAARAS